MKSARRLLGRLSRCKPLVVVGAVVAGVVVYYTAVFAMVWGLLNQIGQDSGWFWVAFLMVKLLPLVFGKIVVEPEVNRVDEHVIISLAAPPEAVGRLSAPPRRRTR